MFLLLLKPIKREAEPRPPANADQLQQQEAEPHPPANVEQAASNSMEDVNELLQQLELAGHVS